MDRSEIINKLQHHHQLFTDYIHSLNEADFMFSLNNEKWAAGLQLDHIYRSVKPLGDGIILPKFVIGLMFGKANRPSKTYDALVQKYHDKLSLGGKAMGNFIPQPVAFSQREEIKNKLQGRLNKLCKHLVKYSEEELDKYIIPHPLIGKLTMREMMYFTIYHVQHHHQMTQQNLAARNA